MSCAVVVFALSVHKVTCCSALLGTLFPISPSGSVGAKNFIRLSVFVQTS